MWWPFKSKARETARLHKAILLCAEAVLPVGPPGAYSMNPVELLAHIERRAVSALEQAEDVRLTIEALESGDGHTPTTDLGRRVLWHSHLFAVFTDTVPDAFRPIPQAPR